MIQLYFHRAGCNVEGQVARRCIAVTQLFTAHFIAASGALGNKTAPGRNPSLFEKGFLRDGHKPLSSGDKNSSLNSRSEQSVRRAAGNSDTMSLLNGMFGLKEGRLTRGKRLPGPSGVPVFGSSPQLGKFTKIWDGFSELHEKYGSLVGVQIGSRYCLLVNNVEDIKEILINRATSFANRPDFLRFQAIFRWNRDLCKYLKYYSVYKQSCFAAQYGLGKYVFQLLTKSYEIFQNLSFYALDII